MVLFYVGAVFDSCEAAYVYQFKFVFFQERKHSDYDASGNNEDSTLNTTDESTHAF
jgi:hypothetical protein